MVHIGFGLLGPMEIRRDEQVLSRHGGKKRAVLAMLLLAAHPTRERAWGRLLLACYHQGDLAAVASVYRDARKALVEELGVEPGAELTALYRSILRRDPELSRPSQPVGLLRSSAYDVGRVTGQRAGRDHPHQAITSGSPPRGDAVLADGNTAGAPGANRGEVVGGHHWCRPRYQSAYAPRCSK